MYSGKHWPWHMIDFWCTAVTVTVAVVSHTLKDFIFIVTLSGRYCCAHLAGQKMAAGNGKELDRPVSQLIQAVKPQPPSESRLSGWCLCSLHMAPRQSHGHRCRHRPCDRRSQAGVGRAGSRSTLQRVLRQPSARRVGRRADEPAAMFCFSEKEVI